MRLQYKKRKKKSLEDHTTIIIKTFERPECLNNLIDSIRSRYKKILILIADDSRKPLDIIGDRIEYYRLPFDVGLSVGRNFLLNKVKTKYFLLLDDDHFFIDNTDLNKMFCLLENCPKLDLISGLVKNIYKRGSDLGFFYGILQYNGGTLYLHKECDCGTICGINRYDVVENFFMSKTKKISKIMWDAQLKLHEHKDFFIRCKKDGIVVAMDSDIIIGHDKNTKKSTFYKTRRNRKYHYLFRKKHNISRVVTTRNYYKKLL